MLAGWKVTCYCPDSEKNQGPTRRCVSVCSACRCLARAVWVGACLWENTATQVSKSFVTGGICSLATSPPPHVHRWPGSALIQWREGRESVRIIAVRFKPRTHTQCTTEEDNPRKKILEWIKIEKKNRSVFTSCHALNQWCHNWCFRGCQRRNTHWDRGVTRNATRSIASEAWIPFFSPFFSFSICGICAFTGMEKKKWIFETMTQEEERRRNDRRGKVKAAVSFHLGQGGDQGRIRREGKKDLLTNWNSITSLPVSAGPPLSHDRRAERKCVGLRQRHTRPVWRQLSVDGSLSHTAELPSPPSHQISFSSKAVNKQGGKLWPPNWNYRKMTKKH